MIDVRIFDAAIRISIFARSVSIDATNDLKLSLPVVAKLVSAFVMLSNELVKNPCVRPATF